MADKRSTDAASICNRDLSIVRVSTRRFPALSYGNKRNRAAADAADESNFEEKLPASDSEIRGPPSEIVFRELTPEKMFDRGTTGRAFRAHRHARHLRAGSMFDHVLTSNWIRSGRSQYLADLRRRSLSRNYGLIFIQHSIGFVPPIYLRKDLSRGGTTKR